jgi:methionyl-tRNA formyltransferase
MTENNSAGPRILYLANNALAVRVLEWLMAQKEQVVGIVVHPHESRKFGDELLAASGLSNDRVVLGTQLTDKATLEKVRSWDPDIAVSVLFNHILKPEFIEIFPRGIINLHPALLPWNRGQYPNVWSIIEGTPAGTTLHYIDEGVDTGAIIDQQEVLVEPVDTGETLYHKLEEASFGVFTRSWRYVRGQRRNGRTQIEEGTYHRTMDVDEIDRIDLDRTYKARDLIDILRARTFPPYTGAYFEVDGRKVYVRLTLAFEDHK